MSALGRTAAEGSSLQQIGTFTAVVGNPNVALLIAATFALLLYAVHRRPSRVEMGRHLESALMSAGIIILITSAGGAFGAMLKEAGVGPVIQNLFTGGDASSGFTLIFIGWVTASLLKISQGSSTVAMITTSSIMAAMIDPVTLAIHPVYIATAIGCGSLCVSWMNDSGFWIVAKMSGLTEIEALKTWTLALVVLSVTGLLVTLGLALLLPMPVAGTP
jgi:GntP family gluconate:H+ symporter